MLWLLATFGSLIELVEIPTVIWLVWQYFKMLNKMEQQHYEFQCKLWDAGLLTEPPSAIPARRGRGRRDERF